MSEPIIFLDFDGVIVDSVKECYMVSRQAYWGYSTQLYEEKIRKSFFEFRGLVRPVHEYGLLHQAIEEYLLGDIADIEERFRELSEAVWKSDAAIEYETIFFEIRNLFKKDIAYWLSLHSLTDYGKSLQNKELKNYKIVTTKDKDSVIRLLNHFNIGISEIYDKDSYKSHGSKGKLMSIVLDQERVSKAIFVDDAEEHLESVTDPRIKCMFADWGYGKGNKFEVYKY